METPTQILEKLIRFRAENVAHMEMKIYPEALVDLLDQKDNEIKTLKDELRERLILNNNIMVNE